MLPDSGGHGLNLVMDRLGDGGFMFASVDRDTHWGCPVRRCQGYGLALTGYDVAGLEGRCGVRGAVHGRFQNSATGLT